MAEVSVDGVVVEISPDEVELELSTAGVESIIGAVADCPLPFKNALSWSPVTQTSEPSDFFKHKLLKWPVMAVITCVVIDCAKPSISV